MVKNRLIEASKWAERASGPVGPSRVRGSCPIYRATLEDHLAEGWGIPEVAGDDQPDERRLHVALSAIEVERLEDVLQWQARYLAGHVVMGRILGLWLRAQALGKKGHFERALRGLNLPKTTGYRLRDRAITTIAMGLERDGVRP